MPRWLATPDRIRFTCVTALLTALTTLSITLSSPAHAETITRTSSFEYDATTGLLTKEIIEPDTANLCVTTTYVYDAYGNKTSATTASCTGASGEALFTSRSSSTGYDTASASGCTIPAGTISKGPCSN